MNPFASGAMTHSAQSCNCSGLLFQALLSVLHSLVILQALQSWVNSRAPPRGLAHAAGCSNRSGKLSPGRRFSIAWFQIETDCTWAEEQKSVNCFPPFLHPLHCSVRLLCNLEMLGARGGGGVSTRKEPVKQTITLKWRVAAVTLAVFDLKRNFCLN